jgi:hypothetical protein
MLGWSISITNAHPDVAAKLKNKEDCAPYALAFWEVWDAYGVRWVDDLAKEFRAVQIKSGGYPNIYVTSAANVLPIITNTNDSMRHVVLHPENIAKCDPESTVTIEIWDLS